MCDFPTHFGPHNIIINLTFCTVISLTGRVIIVDANPLSGGDWAGAAYSSSGCPSTCEGQYGHTGI